MTSYSPLGPIRVAELFDGRLEQFGIREPALGARLAAQGAESRP